MKLFSFLLISRYNLEIKKYIYIDVCLTWGQDRDYKFYCCHTACICVCVCTWCFFPFRLHLFWCVRSEQEDPQTVRLLCMPRPGCGENTWVHDN